MAALIYASRLPDAPYEIVLAASNNPDAEGLALADHEGIATFARAHKGIARAEHDATLDVALREADADYVVLAGYMRILGDDFVSAWSGRLLNIHPSLLPKYRGLQTHARAIEAGDSHGGASVHLVTAELDAGEVLGQISVRIIPQDTPETLASRVRIAEHQLYPQVLSAFVSRPYDSDWLLGELRRRALAMPESEERESHGAPAWRTGGKNGKFFAHFSDRHHGAPHIALFAKTSGPDEMEGLIEAHPEAYFKPPYYGASGWIGVILNRPSVDWNSVEDWLQRSWSAVAPKRLTNLRRAAEQF